jgi:hypothetical protein
MPCASTAFSEHEEIGERASLMQATDCVRKQWPGRHDGQLIARRIGAEPKWRNRVANDKHVNRRIAKDLCRAEREQAMRDKRDDTLRTGFASGAGGTQECATRADQIIDHESGGAGDITDEQVTGNNAPAPVLVDKGLADRLAAGRFQRLTGSARLAPPEIVAGQRSRVIDEQRRSGQRYGAAAKRILERTRTSSVTMQSVPMVPNRLAT